MKALSRPLLILVASLCLLACEQQQQELPPRVEFEPELAADTELVDRRTQNVWLQGVSLIDSSLAQARQLREAVEVLLRAPDEDNLNRVREAWHRSHNAYLAAELFTALGSSNPGLFGGLSEYDFALEAWPIQPGYLDYFDVYQHSGIVNDTAMPLTAEALRQQHGLTDAADVSLGFHAMEYLLWGENGERPASDYEERELSSEQIEAELRRVDLPNNRRRVYLQLLANLLIDDLESYKKAMEEPRGLLQRSYLGLPPYSRVRLFEGAAYAMLSHHRDLLQAQLESYAASEGETVLVELQHMPFAGNSAEPLQHSLATLKEILLDEEAGLAQWLSESSENAPSIEELLHALEESLAALEGPWPPEGEKGAELLSELTLLSERFEPQLPAHH